MFDSASTTILAQYSISVVKDLEIFLKAITKVTELRAEGVRVS